MNLIKATCLAAATGICALAGTAAAATVYASQVEAYSPGTVKGGGSFQTGRNNPLNALGSPATPAGTDFPDFGTWTTSTSPGFVSLGFGGSLDLSFGTLFGPPLAVIVETTNQPYPTEKARVELFDPNLTIWVPIIGDTVDNEGDNTVLVPAGPWSKLRLVDITNPNLHTNGADGFDVQSVEVNAVPLPAAALGGIALMGAIGTIQIRKRRKDAVC